MKFRKPKVLNYTVFNSDKLSVVEYLYSLGDSDINGDINDLITTHDQQSKKEIIESILLDIGNLVSDEDYHKVEDELKKEFIKK